MLGAMLAGMETWGREKEGSDTEGTVGRARLTLENEGREKEGGVGRALGWSATTRTVTGRFWSLLGDPIKKAVKAWEF